MNSTQLRRLFKAIADNDNETINDMANLLIEEEMKKGHNKVANNLKKILKESNTRNKDEKMVQLPVSRRYNQTLAVEIPFNQLQHNMILNEQTENRFKKIEKEYLAKERLSKYNLRPKTKILLYGPSGCGKTLGAQRLAWNLGLPLIKVKFDAIISSFLGESTANLRAVFEMSQQKPCILLLDECDFIAKARNLGQDVGEIPRIVNMLLMLLDEYKAPGLLIATTNLEKSLDNALFRRFDDVIEIKKPEEVEIKRIFDMTLSAMKVEKNINWDMIVEKVKGMSAANIVTIAENAAKESVLEGNVIITQKYIENAIVDIFKY